MHIYFKLKKNILLACMSLFPETAHNEIVCQKVNWISDLQRAVRCHSGPVQKIKERIIKAGGLSYFNEELLTFTRITWFSGVWVVTLCQPCISRVKEISKEKKKRKYAPWKHFLKNNNGTSYLSLTKLIDKTELEVSLNLIFHFSALRGPRLDLSLTLGFSCIMRE